MKKLTLLMLVLVVSSGCSATRYMTIGVPAPIEPPLAGLSEDATWRLGDVHVSVQSSNAYSPIPTGLDVGPLKQQLRDRVRATLLAQSALGATTGPSKYALELHLEAVERHGVGRQMGLALGLETAVLVVGAAVGAALGLATSRDTPPSGFSNGLLIGTGVSIPLALVAASLPKLGGVAGEYRARLVLRRLADRVSVAELHVESSWRFDYNFYDIPAKVAQGSGDGFVEFEKLLLGTVKDLLVEANPPPAAAAP